jgi:phosphoribosyl-AMP cyclohydrolase
VLCYSKHVLDLSLHCLVEWIRTIKYSFGYRTLRIADLSRQEAVADNVQPSMLQVPPRRRHHIVGTQPLSTQHNTSGQSETEVGDSWNGMGRLCQRHRYFYHASRESWSASLTPQEPPVDVTLRFASPTRPCGNQSSSDVSGSPTDKSPRAAARRKLRILACTERTTTVSMARTAVCDVILSRATLISRAFESAYAYTRSIAGHFRGHGWARGQYSSRTRENVWRQHDVWSILPNVRACRQDCDEHANQRAPLS